MSKYALGILALITNHADKWDPVYEGSWLSRWRVRWGDQWIYVFYAYEIAEEGFVYIPELTSFGPSGLEARHLPPLTPEERRSIFEASQRIPNSTRDLYEAERGASLVKYVESFA